MMLFTLGYEKRNISDFIEILRRARVDTLVDVRETAWSHKRDFCKTKFSTALKDVGIEYIHLKQLGNPKQLRKSTSKDGILNKYKSYLEETESGIFELLVLLDNARVENKNVCLTCFEKLHVECHRSIIADHIKGSISGKITHL